MSFAGVINIGSLLTNCQESMAERLRADNWLIKFKKITKTDKKLNRVTA